MPSPGQFVCALLATVLGSVVGVPLAAQQAKTAAEPAQQLASDVIWNELHARQDEGLWSYLSTRTSAGQTLVQEQVETSDGPVFRVLERNGTPLNADQQQREAHRVDAYIHNSSAIARQRHNQEENEAHLASIMKIVPQAFLFAYQGTASGDIVQLVFRPNPAFTGSGYDDRIVHALSGTMTLNLRQKRLIDMRGAVSQPVDIGFGLLGSVSAGSTFEIHRCQVSAAHWRTDLLEIHIHGRFLLFKGISKDEREARSGFHPVPGNTSLAQADRLLAAANPLQAQLGGIGAGSPSVSAVTSVSSDP
ncbi:MAG: hypothetical protein WCA44_00865 [Acidobacteriaceae bacterium]